MSAPNGSAAAAANGSAVALPKGYKEVPLSKSHVDDPRGGSLLLYSHTEFEKLKSQLNGVFSFVYYYKPNTRNRNANVSDFLGTLWYKGLQFYLNFVHDPHGTLDRGEAEKANLFSQLKNPDGSWAFIDRSKHKSTALGIGTVWGPNDIETVEEAMKTPPLSHEEAARFESWGVVIYTDVATHALLRGVFPLEKYPKLVIAVVNWPYYSIEGGVCEPSIMRTMRLQCTELFQGKTLCVRDADTIFVRSLEYNPEYIQYLIMWWESEFLKPWITEYNIPKKPEDPWMYDPVDPIRDQLSFEKYHLLEKVLIIGTMNNYISEWHTNLPGPYPIQSAVQTYRTRDPWKPLDSGGNDPRPSVYRAFRGVFAGFVNISRKNIQPLWSKSVDYLLQRYFIAMSGTNRVISDIYCRSITGAHIGKDERILLFVYPSLINSYYLEYYYIEYSSVVSNHGHFINALSWPFGLIEYHGTGGQKDLLTDHLLTPYYNKGVYKTATKVINDDLNETMGRSFEEYGKYISAMNFPKASMKAANALQECNPRLAKEDLFLKEAGFLPPEAFAARLEDAVPSLNNLRRTQKAKQDAINKKFGIVRGSKPRRRRTRKN